MEAFDRLFEDAVTAYRQRLLLAVKAMAESRDAAGFCAAERALLDLTRELAAEFTRGALQTIADDKQRTAETLAALRARARERHIDVVLIGDRDSSIVTLGGQTIRVRSAYALSKPWGGRPLKQRGANGTGVFVVLDQIGIAEHATPAARLLIARTVAEANSVTSARELLSASGFDIDHKGALRLTYDVCDDALRARAAAVRAQERGVDGPLRGRRVIATVDGGRVLIRRRTAGRPKKGGRKHFTTEWREPKVLTVYVVGPDGKRDRSFPSVIDGTLGDADAVFDLLRFHLLRLGADTASELALVGDGAPWIWNRADALREALAMPRERFTEVIDYFHAVERLHERADEQGWDDDERNRWVAARKAELKTASPADVERAVMALRFQDPGARECEQDFWSRNRGRLDHATALRRGLPIGSGAVESAVRRVVNLRMKGASIAWTEDHAEGILHLRSHAKSARWAELEQVILANMRWIPTNRRPQTGDAP